MASEEWKNQAELLQELCALRKRVAEFEQAKHSLKHKGDSLNESQSAPIKSYMTKPLTRTELKVLHLILNGKSNKEIAALLHRSVRTIEVHRSHIMRKFEVDNVIDLFKRAAAIGLVELPASSYHNSAKRK